MIDRDNKDWWRGAVIYQIYPRSFFDRDGNGVGDIGGIEAKLDDIAALGVDAIWISPFYKSPMDDFGYDITDYCDVDPLFGSLDDFKAMLASAHNRGLRVLIDVVISHTSDRHPWFVESRESRDNPKADWYVWADANPDGTVPNNWLSCFGGTSWEWDSRRCQYYLHNFLKSQPDLNFHNPEVQNAVLEAAKFWLDLGVNGFRLDTVNFYFHDAELRNNPPLAKGAKVNTTPASNPYAFQDHVYDKTRPENLKFLERLRALVDTYPGRTLVGELGADGDVPALMSEYTVRDKRLHMAYAFELMTSATGAAYIRGVAEAMNKGIGDGWVCWALSNHDVTRVLSRWNYEDVADQAGPMLVALLASLRGTPCMYQGEELALTEADVPFEKLQDPYGKTFWPRFKGRDGCRTPYPWIKDAPEAGFSVVEPWLPVPAEHAAKAYDVQSADAGSPLARIRRFLAWRKTQPALALGSMRFLDTPEPVLAFVRNIGEDTILAVFNLGRGETEVALSGLGKVAPFANTGFAADFRDGSVVVPPLGAAFARVASA